MATLTEILNALAIAAEKYPGDPQRYMLPHKLRVDVKVEKGLIFLQLSRRSTWPSAQELQTVLAHWPSPQPQPLGEPLQRHYLGRYYLMTSWRLPARLLTA